MDPGTTTLPSFCPATTMISVKLTGFKEFLRKGIHLGAGETPTIDAKLEVGEAMQTIEVTDVVPAHQ